MHRARYKVIHKLTANYNNDMILTYQNDKSGPKTQILTDRSHCFLNTYTYSMAGMKVENI